MDPYAHLFTNITNTTNMPDMQQKRVRYNLWLVSTLKVMLTQDKDQPTNTMWNYYASHYTDDDWKFLERVAIACGNITTFNTTFIDTFVDSQTDMDTDKQQELKDVLKICHPSMFLQVHNQLFNEAEAVAIALWQGKEVKPDLSIFTCFCVLFIRYGWCCGPLDQSKEFALDYLKSTPSIGQHLAMQLYISNYAIKLLQSMLPLYPNLDRFMYQTSVLMSTLFPEEHSN
jgi:hypothetical protein